MPSCRRRSITRGRHGRRQPGYLWQCSERSGRRRQAHACARRRAPVSAARAAGPRIRQRQAAAATRGPLRGGPCADRRPRRQSPWQGREPRLRHPRSGVSVCSYQQNSTRGGRLHLSLGCRRVRGEQDLHWAVGLALQRRLPSHPKDSTGRVASVPRQPRHLQRVGVLRAMPQQMVRQHAGQHRFADRHRADPNAGIVPTLGYDLGLLPRPIHRPPRR